MFEKHFVYNADTGEIRRVTRRNSNGSLDKDGYLIIKFFGRQIKAHRLAWYLHYGHWPINVIDHINGKRADNRICNLRDVTQKENVVSTKRKPNIETKVVGVYIDRTKGLKKKFATKIEGRTYRFYSIKDAIIRKYETI